MHLPVVSAGTALTCLIDLVERNEADRLHSLMPSLLAH